MISGSGALTVGVSNGVSIPGESLTLTNVETYTGADAGCWRALYLTGVCSISNSASIAVSNGSVLDMTGLTRSVVAMGLTQNLLGSGTINGPSVTLVTGSRLEIFPARMAQPERTPSIAV